MGKKIFTILRWNFCLSKPVVGTVLIGLLLNKWQMKLEAPLKIPQM